MRETIQNLTPQFVEVKNHKLLPEMDKKITPDTTKTLLQTNEKITFENKIKVSLT